MKIRKGLKDSFGYALAGIIYALKTQRNMRIHFIAALAVLLFSSFFNLSKFELLALFFAIVFVIFAEMINTAIESTVDILTDEYHPKAEIAKNVAAGAVLIAVFNSIVVGVLVFLKKINEICFGSIFIVTQSNLHFIFIVIIALFLIAILLIAFYISK